MGNSRNSKVGKGPYYLIIKVMGRTGSKEDECEHGFMDVRITEFVNGIIEKDDLIIYSEEWF